MKTVIEPTAKFSFTAEMPIRPSATKHISVKKLIDLNNKQTEVIGSLCLYLRFSKNVKFKSLPKELQKSLKSLYK
jgi:hypothetical protein